MLLLYVVISCLHGWQDIDYPLSELHAEFLPRPQKGSKKQLKKNSLFLNFLSCPQVYHGGGCHKKMMLDGATDFLSKIYATLQQLVLCQLKYLN